MLRECERENADGAKYEEEWRRRRELEGLRSTSRIPLDGSETLHADWPGPHIRTTSKTTNNNNNNNNNNTTQRRVLERSLMETMDMIHADIPVDETLYRLLASFEEHRR